LVESIIGAEVAVVRGNFGRGTDLVDIMPGIQAVKLNPQINKKKIRRDHILPIKNYHFKIRRMLIQHYIS
jgi:hypothetical protein